MVLVFFYSVKYNEINIHCTDSIFPLECGMKCLFIEKLTHTKAKTLWTTNRTNWKHKFTVLYFPFIVIYLCIFYVMHIHCKGNIYNTQNTYTQKIVQNNRIYHFLSDVIDGSVFLKYLVLFCAMRCM